MSFLEMSFSAAVLIIAITVIRALTINRLPKRTFLALWGVAMIRLLVPFEIPSAFSVYSLMARFFVPAVPDGNVSSDYLVPPSITPPSTISPSVEQASSYPVSWWVVVRLVGAMVCALFFTVSYSKCRRKFQTSLPVDANYAKYWLNEHQIRRPIEIRQSDRITAPLSYGVFRPVILMPKKTDWENRKILQYVLAHEYVHICRFDTVTKLVMSAVLCIHWFNPLVWIMYVLANRDIELSCDEAVIRQLGEQTKSAYAMTLIRMEEVKSGIVPFCNCFSKNATEERIIAIMKFKKTSVFAAVLALVLVGGTTIAFATSVSASESPNEFTLGNLPQGTSVTTTDGCVAGWEPDTAKTTQLTNEEATALIEQGNFLASFSLDDLPAGTSITNNGDICDLVIQPASESAFSRWSDTNKNESDDAAAISFDAGFGEQSKKTSIAAQSSIYYNFGAGVDNTYYEADTVIEFSIQCVNADIPVQVSLVTADKTRVISSRVIESNEVTTIPFVIPEDGDYLICVTNESASRTQEYSHAIVR